MDPYSKASPISIEQNADPVLFNFRGQMVRLLFDEKKLGANPIYNHCCQNKKRIIIKVDILYRQNYNDVVGIIQLQALLPVQLGDILLNFLHGQAGKHPGMSKMMQEIRQNFIFYQLRTTPANK